MDLTLSTTVPHTCAPSNDDDADDFFKTFSPFLLRPATQLQSLPGPDDQESEATKQDAGGDDQHQYQTFLGFHPFFFIHDKEDEDGSAAAEGAVSRIFTSPDDERKPKPKGLFEAYWIPESVKVLLKCMLRFHRKKGLIPRKNLDEFLVYVTKKLRPLKMQPTRRQLYDKIRRLEKKYHKAVARTRPDKDSTALQKTCFRLSKKIWGKPM